MEYDKFIEKDPQGTYCILFANRDGLELSEIEAIFSEYGIVYSIKCAGDEKGYRFIRYKLFQEALSALEGMKNHPTIKLSEHRKKNKIQGSYESNSSDNKSNSNKNFDKKNQFKNGSFNKYNNQEKNLETMEDHSEPETFQDNNCSSQSVKIPRFNENSSSMKSGFMKENNLKNSIKVNSSTSLNSLPDFVNKYNASLEKKSNSTSSIYEDKVPDLISSKAKAMSEKIHKKILLNAQEIIVGNIHPDYSASYVLHLFEHFEPIAVTKINILVKTGIRYCSVYFKTTEDAMEVENQFDQRDLKGKKLLVLRPCQLMEEAVCWKQSMQVL